MSNQFKNQKQKNYYGHTKEQKIVNEKLLNRNKLQQQHNHLSVRVAKTAEV